MTTSFCFEHVFRASTPQLLLRAYFDPAHTAVQDAAIAVASREVLEVSDADGVFHRVTKIVPQRQLPAFMRPFFPGTLHYIEDQTWRHGTTEIACSIRPSILGGRAHITSVYRLEQAGAQAIRRTHAGSVSVEVALVGGRIERSIVADIERSMRLTAACTQTYLDRHELISTHAQATGT